ncbi:ATP-grasp domain-containing protein [Luteimonas sp. SJ-92]|uniref:ATP-grasp domain-containing protein n=1 Tax=Luteimonas salinisoli TaxID=2752307 RepID=A0A853J957_9GAMM|nr:ATP-grasp domain-containing protein [Luteimonas salinisoli]NZA25312.1 ATP-grasp domain-containing protein [Luteimonas salinisoli]
MSRLLILGAGPFQLSGIRKAVDLGHEVITLDYRPDNVGHRYSHRSVNCSTADAQGVARAARDLDVDGICTFSSDVAIQALALACSELGLPGVAPEIARTMSLKNRFRRFLEEKGLPHPLFAAGESFDMLREPIGRMRCPLIFKPVDTSGSRGVISVPEANETSARAAFDEAKRFSPSGTVCVEEFIQGTEVGGDALLLDGKIAFVAITHKHLSRFVVTGHSLPADIDAADQARVQAALDECCRALGYSEGVLNFDVMVTAETVYVLEMSARNGGNGIAAVIARATGVDAEVAAIRLALGERPDLRTSAHPKGVASWIFGSDSSGTLKRIADFDAVRQKVPELFEFHQAIPVGGKVEPFTHGGQLLGYALFDCPEPALYAPTVGRIRKALDLAVEPG